MKIPKRISDLITQKQDFIDTHRDRMEKSVIKLQSQLLDKVIAEIVPELDIKDGVITDSKHNYQILGKLDAVYKDFTSGSSALISSQISGVTVGLTNLGKQYFASILADNLTTRFEKIVESTANLMNARIGLSGGQMVRGGFLETFLKDQTLATQIKNYISKSVTGQIPTKEFVKGLGDIINGIPKEVIKDSEKVIVQIGALEKQYQRYGYDLYQQYDAAYNSTLATEFDMNYFIYQGGLVVDSRDFCAAHNGKVWSKKEAKEWVKWTPSLGEYPAGWEIKQKDHYLHPGYMDYPGYQPLIDRGGYNCRHMIAYISDELAKDLRPDLK